jgi:hypothetical protein
MVEPFRYIDYRHGTADGLIRCHNEYQERTDWEKFHALPREERKEKPPTKIVPCFYFGELEQARVTEPEDWAESYCTEAEKVEPFIVRCKGCKSDNVEIIKLEESK